jgi:hypothetical protein
MRSINTITYTVGNSKREWETRVISARPLDRETAERRMREDTPAANVLFVESLDFPAAN